MRELQIFVKSRFLKDLAPFLDPGAQIEATATATGLLVKWEQDEKILEAILAVRGEDYGAQIKFEGRDYPYKAFFASERMANLPLLARNILRGVSQPIFVQTKGKLSVDSPAFQSGGMASLEAKDAIRKSIEYISNGVTRFTMVVAEAGAGKTHVLRQLALDQAGAYLSRQAQYLFLYVDAQGRALARLYEAISAQLDDLRIRFGYDVVTTLVRCGLIVPIIDGFDELLGVSGYDDAFSSIGSFISELDGDGSIVASARSTYYEQEFLSRASTASTLGAPLWQLSSVQVLGWEEEERNQCVAAIGESINSSGADIDAAKKQLGRIFRGKSIDLGKKPLFVSRIARLVLEGETIGEGDEVLDRLVEIQVSREVRDKLKNKAGNSVLTDLQFSRYLQELAEEMWLQGVRELDRQTARDVAAVVLSDMNLSEDAQRVVVERASTAALLQQGARAGSVSFEHEIFFAFFLARALIPKFNQTSTILSGVLGRSLLPDDVARITAHLMLEDVGCEHESRSKDIIERLCDIAQIPGLAQGQTKENVGILLIAFIRNVADRGLPLSNVKFHGVVFPGGDLHGVHFQKAAFRGTEFRRSLLSSSRFSDCEFEDVQFHLVKVDAQTHIAVAIRNGDPSFIGLEFLGNDGSVSEIFNPIDLAKHLKGIGVLYPDVPSAAQREIPNELLSVVEKLVRAYMTRNIICEQDDKLKPGLFSHHLWPRVRAALLQSGVAVAETRPTHGPSRNFFRRKVNYDEIMLGLDLGAHVSPEVSRFWQLLST